MSNENHSISYFIKSSIQKKIFFGCLLFFFGILRGHGQDYQFEKLSIEDGLSQNFIHDLTQDYRGFLWFATRDGLNRYDGYGFKIYNYVPEDTTSLSSNVVTVLHEDKEQNLWIGAGALNRYDRLHDKIERVITADDLQLDQVSLSIDVIETDHNGDVWIVVNGVGMYRIKINLVSTTDTYQIYGPYQIKANTNYLNDNDKYYDIQSVGNKLWISHRQGLFVLSADNNDEFPSPERADFQNIDFGKNDNPLWCKALFLEGDALWISSRQGLIKLPKPEQPQMYELYPIPSEIALPPGLATGRDIARDLDGRLWMSSYSGIIVFDPSNQTYHQIKNDPNSEESLSLDNTTAVLTDQSGLVWVGTGGLGINKYDRRQMRFTHYLDKKKSKKLYSIYNIIEDDRGIVWFTESFNKLGYLNPYTNTYDLFDASETDNWHITDMAKGRDGMLWLANKLELIKFDPNAQSYITYKAPTSILRNESENYAIHVDLQGQIWLCNALQILRFNPQSENFTPYPLPDLNLEQINTLYHDNEDVLWIGSHQGLVKYNITNKTYEVLRSNPESQVSLHHPRIKNIQPDPSHPDQFLWISTGGGGFCKFDKTKHHFTTFTQKDGLANNFVYGILVDEQGMLWMSTNHGLSRFNPDTEKFNNFVRNDGLQSNEFNSRSFHKNDKGELYFGGINGITKFTPENIRPNTHMPPVVISELWLMYKSILPNSEDSPLSHAVNETKQLHLNYDQNNISFKFTALDFTAPEKNQYQYKLEGFDEKWVLASSERRASYTNLAPGEYIFRVIGSNNDGIWNQEGASMQISISPPIWKSWWAYTTYFFMALGVILLFQRYQTERIRMSEEIKRKEFQNEKLAELDQFKSRFFANISHEFRTPLSLIMGYADSIGSSLKEGKQHHVYPLISSIKQNTYHVTGLIDQLLDISRLENNKLKINNLAGDLTAFLKVLCASLQSGADHKGINLSFYSSTPYLYALMDWEIIQKIVQNLIVNAIKFTSEGGNIKVSLETYQWKENKSSINSDWCRVQVRDDGIGIAEDQLPHIFDRFYTSNQQETSSHMGFGLGLSMVKELVSILGGKVEVESKPGQGSVFTIHLPYIIPKDNIHDLNERGILDNDLIKTANAELKIPQKTNTIELNANKGQRDSILLIEDNEELRAYLRQILSAEYEVYEAENGKEGLELAVQKIPSLIITDLMMPELDGMEMAKTLKEDFKTSHIPIIILTAKADIEDKLESLDLGVDDYLVKPFNKNELKKKIRSLINIRQILRLKHTQSLLSSTQAIGSNPTLDEKFLQQLNHKIQSNLPDEHYGVEKLAAELSMSPSQLYRKVKALTGLSTVQLIQTYRIEQAKVYLEQGYNVSEVTYMVGFTSPAYFSQIFKKYTGQKPKDYGKKDYSQS